MTTQTIRFEVRSVDTDERWQGGGKQRVRSGSTLAFGMAAILAGAAPAWAGVTERVSVGSGGVQAEGGLSSIPSLSANGRFVVFLSRATNLVAGDTNGAGRDVYVRDRRIGTTSRVDVVQEEGGSGSFTGVGSISADGRYIVFQSAAANLVPGDTNNATDVFVHDRRRDATTRVSIGPGGAQADSSSQIPTISADGRYVAFRSVATNLVPGDTNDQEDVFVHDRRTGTTTRVSVGAGGVQAEGGRSMPEAISADGRYVVFRSEAANLVPGDTNGATDIFVRDLVGRRTERVSVGSGGVQGQGFVDAGASISGDGRYVAFSSQAPNLVPGDTNDQADVFVHDRRTRTTTRVNLGPGGVQAEGGRSHAPTLSENGRYIAFASGASNLIAGDTNGQEDVFVHDRRTGTTSRVSVGPGGAQSLGSSSQPVISADGLHVAFTSSANDLVPGDTNNESDVFVHDR